MSRATLSTLLALTVASVWTGTAVDAVFFDRPIPFDAATTVMLVVVGFYMNSTRRNGD